jgi:hypothetical protein
MALTSIWAGNSVCHKILNAVLADRSKNATPNGLLNRAMGNIDTD